MSGRSETRERIVDAAALLLRDHGTSAVTTRRVAEAAGVQAPAIYRLFGDKDGLLDAVAEHVLADFVAQKAAVVEAAAAGDVDPLEDLRAGWRAQIEFGLAHPALFRLLSDPERGLHSPVVRSGLEVLEARVHRVAATGRLRVSERRAVGLVQAAGTGVLTVLLSTPAEERDEGLAEAAYEAVLREVLTDPEQPTVSARGGTAAAAVALRAVAPRLDALSPAEQRLLSEWLDRIVDDPARGPG
ncbi:TetR/AcrR family transcriptional regulator [Blastococcus sp. URHD0036]|uniref:TetR/AcrR family transcriptional regulator n=1 Tax=Blastococcus sp. URHD0036 TaxID=1380356 RepID=UPI00068AA9BE|nr:TetR/AcrR family transcriptional regulator [Blastococcus sp. URHD0036]